MVDDVADGTGDTFREESWLDHFGLASSTSSVVLHTDAERAGLPFKEGTGTSAGPHLLLHGERPVDTSYAELGQDAGLGEVQRH